MNKGVTLFRELDSAIALLVEETDLSYGSLNPDIGCLVHLLDKIPDFRDEKLVSYRLSNLLLISLVLIMKREFRSFRYAASYIKAYEKDFARMGLIEEGKVPSHDTLKRMFMLLDDQEVKKALINNMDTFLAKILKNWSSEEKELISVDGKEFRDREEAQMPHPRKETRTSSTSTTPQRKYAAIPTRRTTRKAR